MLLQRVGTSSTHNSTECRKYDQIFRNIITAREAGYRVAIDWEGRQVHVTSRHDGAMCKIPLVLFENSSDVTRNIKIRSNKNVKHTDA